MNPISVVSVVHNEGEHIARAFADLGPYVDDYVVIDQESTDDTVKIAEIFTDKIFLFPRVYYSYSYIHEACLMAKHNWVLKCDPDEKWDKEILEQLGNLINSDQDSYGYDLIKFRMVYWGDNKSFNPRLWRKDKVIWTDSLDARPYNQDDLEILEVKEGVITNLRTYEESLNRYRVEAARRLLVRYGDTNVPFYKEMCKYYNKIMGEI